MKLPHTLIARGSLPELIEGGAAVEEVVGVGQVQGYVPALLFLAVSLPPLLLHDGSEGVDKSLHARSNPDVILKWSEEGRHPRGDHGSEAA